MVTPPRGSQVVTHAFLFYPLSPSSPSQQQRLRTPHSTVDLCRCPLRPVRHLILPSQANGIVPGVALTSIFVRLPRINKSSSCGDISDLGQDLLVLPAAAPSEKGTDLKRELHKASLAMVSPNDPLCRESGGCGFGFELRGARREEPCLVD